MKGISSCDNIMQWMDMIIDIDGFIAGRKTVFHISAKSKRFYTASFRQAGVEKPSFPPAPVIRYSWLEAVIQHVGYFQYYQTMMKSVQTTYNNTAGVESLVYILTDDERREELDMLIL